MIGHPGRVKYTKRPDDSGWLAVLLSASGARAYLCEFTKVEVLTEVGGRTVFKIMDGNSDHVGKEASLRKENADKFLTDTPPNGPAVVIVRYTGEPTEEKSQFKGLLKQQWAKAGFPGQQALVTLNSVWGQNYSPVPIGEHLIMAPDRSHANISTAAYRNATQGLRCTDAWFPIQLAGMAGKSGRYIHVGHLSEGCVTVYELNKWNACYDYLIASRMSGPVGKFVGLLIVRK